MQEILLAQEPVEFDPNQKNLPTDIALTLQQAQQSTQQQHKNLWGLPGVEWMDLPSLQGGWSGL